MQSAFFGRARALQPQRCPPQHCPPLRPCPPEPQPRPCDQRAKVDLQEVCADCFVPYCKVAELVPCPVRGPNPLLAILFKFQVQRGHEYTGFEIDGQLNDELHHYVSRVRLNQVLSFYLETVDQREFVRLPFGYTLRQDTPFRLPFTGRGLLLFRPHFLNKLWDKIGKHECNEHRRKALFEALLRQVAPVLLTITQVVLDHCR